MRPKLHLPVPGNAFWATGVMPYSVMRADGSAVKHHDLAYSRVSLARYRPVDNSDVAEADLRLLWPQILAENRTRA
jgi:hypothetical protein